MFRTLPISQRWTLSKRLAVGQQHEIACRRQSCIDFSRPQTLTTRLSKLHVSMLLLIWVDGLTPHCMEAARLFSQRVLAIEAFSQEALDLVVLSQREEWVRLRSSNVKPARWRQSCSNTAHADMCLFLVYYSISRWWLCYKGVGKSHCCYYQLIAVGVES